MRYVSKEEMKDIAKNYVIDTHKPRTHSTLIYLVMMWEGEDPNDIFYQDFETPIYYGVAPAVKRFKNSIYAKDRYLLKVTVIPDENSLDAQVLHRPPKKPRQ